MRDEQREQLSDYLTGEMDPARAAEFERAVAADPGLAAEVERLRPVVARLESLPAEVWAAPDPPPLDLSLPEYGFEGAAQTSPSAGAPETGPARPADLPDERDRPARRGRRFWPALPRPAIGLALAAVFLVIGFGLGQMTSGDGPAITDPAAELALEPFGEGGPAASGDVLVASGDTDPGEVELVVSGLDPSEPGEFYELWLIGADEELVALASFRVGADGDATVRVPLPFDPERFEYFDVSIQAEDGGPEHSGRSVLRGLTRS